MAYVNFTAPILVQGELVAEMDCRAEIFVDSDGGPILGAIEAYVCGSSALAAPAKYVRLSGDLYFAAYSELSANNKEEIAEAVRQEILNLDSHHREMQSEFRAEA